MKKIFLILLFAATHASAKSTAYNTGNSIHAKLNSDSIVDKAYSLGYVVGVVDARFSECKSLKSIQANQLVDTVKIFLENNPEKRHYSASSIIEQVISEKFRCK